MFRRISENCANSKSNFESVQFSGDGNAAPVTPPRQLPVLPLDCPKTFAFEQPRKPAPRVRMALCRFFRAARPGPKRRARSRICPPAIEERSPDEATSRSVTAMAVIAAASLEIWPHCFYNELIQRSIFWTVNFFKEWHTSRRRVWQSSRAVALPEPADVPGDQARQRGNDGPPLPQARGVYPASYVGTRRVRRPRPDDPDESLTARRPVHMSVGRLHEIKGRISTVAACCGAPLSWAIAGNILSPTDMRIDASLSPGAALQSAAVRARLKSCA